MRWSSLKWPGTAPLAKFGFFQSAMKPRHLFNLMQREKALGEGASSTSNPSTRFSKKDSPDILLPCGFTSSTTRARSGVSPTGFCSTPGKASSQFVKSNINTPRERTNSSLTFIPLWFQRRFLSTRQNASRSSSGLTPSFPRRSNLSFVKMLRGRSRSRLMSTF